MNTLEKTQLYSGLIIAVLAVALIVVAATYPKAPDDGVITYRGWSIYKPSNTTSVWTATKNGQPPLSDEGLLEIVSIIDEVEK